MAFGMNASSRKVLQEVLTSLLIMELNVRWSGIRGRRCPKTKRVLRQSGFAIGCHKATNARKRDRGRERDNQKSTNKIIYIRI